MKSERLETNVRESAEVQASPEHRENYLRSCENHGGELAEVARQIRNEFMTKTELQASEGAILAAEQLDAEGQLRCVANEVSRKARINEAAVAIERECHLRELEAVVTTLRERLNKCELCKGTGHYNPNAWSPTLTPIDYRCVFGCYEALEILSTLDAAKEGK